MSRVDTWTPKPGDCHYCNGTGIDWGWDGRGAPVTCEKCRGTGKAPVSTGSK